MMRVVWLVVLLAGCLQNNLVPCGDKLCARGTTCVDASRCASPDQLAACTNKSNGESCAVNAAVGVCDRGVCVAVGCGNGVVDPGELCDDGNTDYGDGCSGDCTSLEACGNGIVDFAAGESCDCGTDAANKPAQCRFANSDAADAECSATCALRFCGDGQLNELEQCDGAQLGAATCGDFGYYRGELSCSSLCRHDTTTCSGRCGDGTIDVAFGEFCDGAPPDSTCLDYGYDAGAVDCSTACSPSVDRCERFGWQKLDGAKVVDMWGSRSLVLVETVQSTYVIINGIRAPAPTGTYTLATGAGTTAYAIGATSMAMWSGGAWSAHAVGWTSGAPTAAVASDTLGLYVVVAGALWRFTSGTWTQTGETGVTGIVAAGPNVVAWSATSLRQGNGTAWTNLVAPAGITAITGAAGAADGTLFVETDDNATWKSGASTLAWALYTSSGFNVARATSVDDLVVITSSNEVRRVTEAGSSSYQPPNAVSRIAVDETDGLIVGGIGGTYRLRTGSWFTTRVDNGWQYAYPEYNLRGLNISPGGSIVVTGTQGPWFMSDAASGQPAIASDSTYSDGNQIGDAAVDVNGDLFATTPEGIYHFYLYEYPIQDSSHVWGPMAVAPDGELLAGGTDVVARNMYPDGVWHSIDIPGYSVALLGRGTDHVIYALTTQSQIISIDESASGIVGVLPATMENGAPAVLVDFCVFANGDIVAVSTHTMFVWHAGAWTSHPIADFYASAVSGTSVTDIWVGGGSTQYANAPFMRWDGARFLPVRGAPTGASVRRMVVTSTVVTYMRGGELFQLPRAARW